MKRLLVIAFGLIVALAVVRPARAELCPKCKDKMFIMNIGKCVECGGPTTSGAHKLCPKCSRKLGQCEHCRAKLKGGPKLDAKTTQHVAKLNAAWAAFTLDLRYFGEQGKPFYNLTLRVPQVKDKRRAFSPAVQLTKKQVLAIIDHLAKDGYLRRAGNQANKDLMAPRGPTYGLFVRGPNALELYEFLGWDLKMLRRLDALCTVLDGDAAAKMDLLIGRMTGLRKQWQAAEQKR